MSKVIFGSHAIKHYYPEFRTPNDLDFINDADQTITRDIQNYWIPEFEDLLAANTGGEYLEPDLLLTTKASHCNWNVHWEKTMGDIMFLKEKGHSIHTPLYKKLVKGWRKIHGKESAPLKGKTSETFFEDAVGRHYVHDDIHEAIAYYDKPLYLRTLTDPESGSVMCSEEKFNQLSHKDKLLMCREEIIVTALERWIVPDMVAGNPPYSAGRAYNDSLKKFVTTMSSGWMSLFLIDNFKDLRFDKSIRYVKLFEKNKHNCRKIK